MTLSLRYPRDLFWKCELGLSGNCVDTCSNCENAVRGVKGFFKILEELNERSRFHFAAISRPVIMGGENNIPSRQSRVS